jgi:hypothetical protein
VDIQHVILKALAIARQREIDDEEELLLLL